MSSDQLNWSRDNSEITFRSITPQRNLHNTSYCSSNDRSIDKSMRYLRQKLLKKNNNDLEESVFGKMGSSNRSFVKPIVDEEFVSQSKSKKSFLSIGGKSAKFEENSEREENILKSRKIQKRIFANKYQEIIKDTDLDFENDETDTKGLRRQTQDSQDFWGIKNLKPNHDSI